MGGHRGGTTAAIRRDLRRIEQAGTGVAPADITVPPGERWKVLGISVFCVTATGGSPRSVRCEEVVGGDIKAAIESPVTVAGDDDVLFMFGPGLPLTPASVPGPPTVEGTASVPLFEMVVNAGEIIRSRVSANGDAGDVITMDVHAEVQFV